MRFIALIIVLIPSIIAVYGVKLMRDTFFSILHWPFPSTWVQFSSGLLFLILGMALIGGFIYRRDNKRQKVTKRLGNRKKLSK